MCTPNVTSVSWHNVCAGPTDTVFLCHRLKRVTDSNVSQTQTYLVCTGKEPNLSDASPGLAERDR